jgi:hypothetical protein
MAACWSHLMSPYSRLIVVIITISRSVVAVAVAVAVAAAAVVWEVCKACQILRLCTLI